jgi:polyhydroxybutyrate depolymerase
LKTRLIHFILIVLALLVVLFLSGVTAFRLANRTNGTLVSSGERRSYLLYVPESYDPSAPVPLVINIHGFAQWPAHQMQLSHWNDLADEYGFIVVYPSGTRFPLRWRTWGEPGGALDPTLDVNFISDLIDKLEEYNIDPNRIYANGLSNGGGMSFLLLCRLADRIAAIGSVAGAYATPWEGCEPTRPVPAILFHGTEDPIVPFGGGTFGRLDVSLPEITKWVETLAQRNGCSEQTLTLPVSADVSGIQFADCDADVVFYTVTGGGHTWPGGEPIPRWIAGHTNTNIDATRVMWEFFQEHPLPPQ